MSLTLPCYKMSVFLYLQRFVNLHFLFYCSILNGALSDDSEALDLSTTNSPAEPLRSPSPDKNMMDSLSRDPKKASAPCKGNSRSYVANILRSQGPFLPSVRVNTATTLH